MELELKKKKDHVVQYLGIPGLLRFVSISPRTVEFRVTENCNSRCVMCNAWKNRSVNELSTEELKDVLRQLRDIGINQLILLGGEPLLRPDIGAIIKEANLLRFRTILVTNGLLLEERAKELLESGITYLTVSVDGIRDSHDAIRGVKGSFDKAIRGIEAILKLKEDVNPNVFVTLITMLLMKQNVDEIPQLVELSRDLHIRWDFNLLDSSLDIFKGIPFSEISVDDKERIDKTIDYLIKVRRESPGLLSPCEHALEYARRYLKGENLDNYHCVHGYELLHIRSHGEVHPCWIMEPIGNLREARLSDIVGTKKHRELAERIYMRQCPGCTNLCAYNIVTKHLMLHWMRCEKERKRNMQNYRFAEGLKY
jgi:MoaA/NifB/PqqE/SkfB family radical SAM enzyme